MEEIAIILTAGPGRRQLEDQSDDGRIFLHGMEFNWSALGLHTRTEAGTIIGCKPNVGPIMSYC
jgi:hypothetical protein